MRTSYAHMIASGAILVFILFSSSALLKLLSFLFQVDGGPHVAVHLLRLSALLVLLALTRSLYHHFGFDRGFDYVKRNAPLMHSLRRALLDAGYCIQRISLLGDCFELPKIEFYPDANNGNSILRIENSIKFQTRLDDIDVSSALKDYVLERTYLTDDRDWYVYELIDASIKLKLRFDSHEEFEAYALSRCDAYHLFLDARTTVPISSALVVGQTGSGKSYALYSLILQLAAKRAVLSLCDPKNSGIAVMGHALDPGRMGTGLDSIVSQLETFEAEMNERKSKIKSLLMDDLDASYSDFGLQPYVIVIDEYAALAYALKARDKKMRDHVAELIASIVLQGRQLGFFIILAMQKSDASLIDTAMRENLPLIIVLGNAQPQTIVTAFGTGVSVPLRDNSPGDGVFTEPHNAPSPKLCQFPDLVFLHNGTGCLGRGSCKDPRPNKNVLRAEASRSKSGSIITKEGNHD